MAEQGGGYGRGLEFLMKQRARVAQVSGSFVRKLYLTMDGSIARYRHLTDAQDVFAHNFHEIQVQGRRRSFTKDVVCLRRVAVDDEGEPTPIDPVETCQYCNQKEPLDMWWKGIGWVYVYRFFTPGPVRPSDNAKPARRGEVAGFVEEVSEPRLHVLKGLIAEQVFTMAGTYGTLVDRDYELHRNGKSGSQFYSLVPLDKEPPSDAVKATLATLPDLIETVFKEFSVQPAGGTVEVTAASAAEPVEVLTPADEAAADAEIVEF